MSFTDAAEHARQQEVNARKPFIVPSDFTIEYKPQPDGSMKEIEWVTWVKKGTQNPSTNVERVDRLRKANSPEWQVIAPYYDSWKKGQEAPINGTPLEAWPGATRELIKALKASNILSVDDFCDMEDSAITRLAIPSLREKRRQAQAFREALKSTSGIASENAKLKAQLEHQAKELAALREMITNGKPTVPDSAVATTATVDAPRNVEAPRKRGRPRKIVETVD